MDNFANEEEIVAQEQNIAAPDANEPAPEKSERGEGESKPLTRSQLVDRWLEVVSTILLAIVAVATAWSGYQSTRWSGVQADNYVQAGGARVESDRAATQAGQERLYDVLLFNNWLNAYNGKQTTLATIYEKRFRDEFRSAFNAWLATDPFNNLNAPAGPLFMPQYHDAASDKADTLEKTSQQYLDMARAANQTGDDYVFVTVFLAVVLFFVAIAQRFDWPAIQIVVLGVGLAMLVIGLFRLATLAIN